MACRAAILSHFMWCDNCEKKKNHVFEWCKTLTSKCHFSLEKSQARVRGLANMVASAWVRAYPSVYIGSNNHVVVTIHFLSPFPPHMDNNRRFFATLGMGRAVRRVPSCLGLRESLQLLQAGFRNSSSILVLSRSFRRWQAVRLCICVSFVSFGPPPPISYSLLILYMHGHLPSKRQALCFFPTGGVRVWGWGCCLLPRNSAALLRFFFKLTVPIHWCYCSRCFEIFVKWGITLWL